MATKRKRKKARKAKANPKKRTTHRRKRHKNPGMFAAAPKRRRRARKAKANPARRYRARRASRRNPSGPMVQVALAAAAGLATYVAANLVNIVANAKFDPMIRRAIAGAGVVGGLALASKKPVIGAGVAAGSAVMLAGTEIAMEAARFLPAKSQNVGAIVMGAPMMLGPGSEQMGAVAVDMGAPAMLLPGSETMGAVAPDPPWVFSSPI